MKRLLAVVLLAGCLTGVGFAAETAAQDEAAANASATATAAPELLAPDAKVFVIGKNKIFHLEQCGVIERAKKDGKEIGKDIAQTTYAEATVQGLNACKQCIDKDARKKPSKTPDRKNAE
ncbi:hypothetical protein FACS1894139_13400 [Planctomycetales bacterium]|nr:hypothetical protein FACS1894107_09570 [Planctomycetales bacterium]GHT06770.1 hypothetical protein FACS1894139_13400 [Planctomycetales bacterium]